MSPHPESLQRAMHAVAATQVAFERAQGKRRVVEPDRILHAHGAAQDMLKSPRPITGLRSSAPARLAKAVEPLSRHGRNAERAGQDKAVNVVAYWRVRDRRAPARRSRIERRRATAPPPADSSVPGQGEEAVEETGHGELAASRPPLCSADAVATAATTRPGLDPRPPDPRRGLSVVGRRPRSEAKRSRSAGVVEASRRVMTRAG